MCQINAPFGENLTKSEIIGLNTQFGSFLFPTKFTLNNQFVVIFKLKIVFWFDYLPSVWTKSWVYYRKIWLSFSQIHGNSMNIIKKGTTLWYYCSLLDNAQLGNIILVELLSYLNFSFSDLSIFDFLIFFRTGQSRRSLRSEEKKFKNHQNSNTWCNDQSIIGLKKYIKHFL